MSPSLLAPLIPAIQELLVELVVRAVLQHVSDVPPPLTAEPDIPLIRSVCDDPIIAHGVQDPRHVGPIIMPVRRGVAHQSILQHGRAVLLERVHRVVHADVAGKGIIRRVEKGPPRRDGRDQVADREEGSGSAELDLRRRRRRCRRRRGVPQARNAVLKVLQRSVARPYFHLGADGVVRLEKSFQTAHGVEVHHVDRVVHRDEGKLNAACKGVLHPGKSLELCRRAIPRGLELVDAPFVGGHTGPVGEILQLPVCRLDGVLVLEVELEHDIHSAVVDALHHFGKSGHHLITHSAALVSEMEGFDEALERAVAYSRVVPLSGVRVVGGSTALLADVCLPAETGVVDHRQIAIRREMDVRLDAFEPGFRGAKVGVA